MSRLGGTYGLSLHMNYQPTQVEYCRCVFSVTWCSPLPLFCFLTYTSSRMEFISDRGNPFYPLTFRQVSPGNPITKTTEDKLVHHGLPNTCPRTRKDKILDLLRSIRDWRLSQKSVVPAHLHRLKGVQEAWLAATDASFARFSELPPELRVLIWTFCCYMHGRLVFVTSGVVDHSWNKDHARPNPGVTAACQESRTVALRHYHAFKGNLTVYFNPNGNDIMYEQISLCQSQDGIILPINSPHLLVHRNPYPLGAHITRLAISCDYNSVYEDYYPYNSSTFRRINRVSKAVYRELFQYRGITSLRELFIVVDPFRRAPWVIDFIDVANASSEASFGHGAQDYRQFFYCRGFSSLQHVLRLVDTSRGYPPRPFKDGSDGHYTTSDLAGLEELRELYLKADCEFEKDEGFPIVRFVEEQFTPGLPVLRYEKYNKSLASLHHPPSPWYHLYHSS